MGGSRQVADYRSKEFSIRKGLVLGQDPKPFPKLELLKAMQVEAKALLSVREKATVVHHARNIVSAGAAIGESVRGVLRKRLPGRYCVGQGHIVNSVLRTSPQFDLIVADNNSFPVLFRDDSGTEWFPCEAVYAVGEVKSSYKKSDKPIEVFSANIARTKAELNWPKRTIFARTSNSAGESHEAVTLSQLFTFMVFLDSRQLKTRDLAPFYKRAPLEDLPNLVYLVDRGVLLNMKFGGKDGTYPMDMNLYPEIADKVGLKEYGSKWCLRLFKDESESVGLGLAFFTFYHLLLSHLESCILSPPSLRPYYVLSLVEAVTRMHLDILD